MRQAMAKTMNAFAPGLFVGEDMPDLPRDNLDLERFFRYPKGHERRIHGHRHAGVRIVMEGPTLVAVLDTHLHHPDAFPVEDLRPYADAPIPKSQGQALQRRRIMRQARSSTQRPLLSFEVFAQLQATGCGSRCRFYILVALTMLIRSLLDSLDG